MVYFNVYMVKYVKSLGELCTDRICTDLHHPMISQNLAFLPINLRNRILVHMTLMKVSGSDAVVSKLYGSHVKQLNTANMSLTDHLLEQIGLCINLVDLQLYNTSCVTSDALCNLFTKLPHLLILNLSGCLVVDTKTVRKLVENCQNMSQLEVSSCPKLDDEAMSVIGILSKLKCLSISNTKVSCTGLRNLVLGDCRKCLKELVMSNCPNIGNTGLQMVVQSCPNLVFMDFQQTNVCNLTAFPEFNKQLKNVQWTIKF